MITPPSTTRRSPFGGHRYPPFARLALFVYAHRQELVCQREAAALVETLTEAGERLDLTDLEVLGPAPCFARRVRW